MNNLTNMELLIMNQQLQSRLGEALKTEYLPDQSRPEVVKIALQIADLCREASRRGIDINIDLNQVIK